MCSTKSPGIEYWVEGSQRHSALKESYYVGKELGRGATSVVYDCEDKKTHIKYAAKVLKKTVNQKTVKSEVSVLLKLSHPNIIKLKEVIETPSEIVLILERVTGGELFDRIMEKGTYSEKDAVHVMKQILEAVSYLHANGVVHRDLKPENILFANLSPNAPLKIGDFGLAKILDKGQVMNTVCGTAGYCAPEVIQGASYGPEVDMWSLGVILYILLCGFEPFFDPRGDPYIFTHVLKCDYEFTSPWWDDISQSAKDLIGKLIVLDPKERLTIQEVLQHPWITGKETGTTFLRGTLQRLQEFNGRFKMKSLIKAMSAITRLRSFCDVSRRRSPWAPTRLPSEFLEERVVRDAKEKPAASAKARASRKKSDRCSGGAHPEPQGATGGSNT
ncbi:calcium/calmodulin-dependent protein kinase type IV-like [Varanus komodoensis]|uniref:calcium/calmodulin-dependent protein kinase type IV-like n=1 Tax=Varanus komodoensis TaxID=61221 RepID=UPI001CF79123|nr:calcium/calmodulin-dependent protein kinase type IV-like [Varanus komodoensis]